MTLVALLAFFLGCGTTSKDAESTPTDDTESADDSPSATCGNGIIDDGEQCDGGNMGGFDCTSLGYSGGTLGCDSVTCTYDAGGCTL